MRPTRLVVSALPVLLAATALGGCASDDQSSGPDATSATAEVEITIRDFDFGEPRTAPVGTPITVHNADGVTHTWTARDGATFDSGGIPAGEEFSTTIDVAGTYEFFCEIHPSMTGTLLVVAP